MPRRRFIAGTGLLGLVLASGVAPAVAQGVPASRRVRVGVIGLGRGMDHVTALLQVSGAEVAAVCDVDQRRRDAAAKKGEEKSGTRPAGFTDLRRMLEDRTLDAVSIATPNFWHAPAAILACRAGKHDYVEKPGSHNAREGERMVEVAASTRRIVQMGTQRRSTETVREAMQALR